MTQKGQRGGDGVEILPKAMTVRQKDTKRDRETRAEKEGHGRDGLNEDRTQSAGHWQLLSQPLL